MREGIRPTCAWSETSCSGEVPNLDPETWFAKPDGLRLTRSTADPLLIKKKHGQLEVRSNFFSIRVIEPWNGLPTEMRGILSPELSKRKYMELKASQMHHA